LIEDASGGPVGIADGLLVYCFADGAVDRCRSAFTVNGAKS